MLPIPQNTNVIEIYGLLKKDARQLTLYNSGVGTYAQPSWKSLAYWKHCLGDKFDLAVAWYIQSSLYSTFHLLTAACWSSLLRNIEKEIIDAYQWLSENYHQGDRIFLLGTIIYFCVSSAS